jgi:hypothetical protein
MIICNPLLERRLEWLRLLRTNGGVEQVARQDHGRQRIELGRQARAPGEEAKPDFVVLERTGSGHHGLSEWW